MDKFSNWPKRDEHPDEVLAGLTTFFAIYILFIQSGHAGSDRYA